ATSIYYGADVSGTPNVITATVSPSILGYVTGQNYFVKVNNTNTSPSVTVNLNGLGAKNLTRLVNNGATWGSGQPLYLSDIIQNSIIEIIYDGTHFQLVNPSTTIQSIDVQADTYNYAQDIGTSGNFSVPLV